MGTPPRAAGYGSGHLMTVAGDLARQAGAELDELGRPGPGETATYARRRVLAGELAQVQARATLAGAYGALALAAALRELAGATPGGDAALARSALLDLGIGTPEEHLAVILDALDVAARAKREQAEDCRDCARLDQDRCEDCRARLDAATGYDALAALLTAGWDTPAPG